MQWGITVLTAAGLNLYYIRRDAQAHLAAQQVLKANEQLPFLRWVVGTLFLVIIASLFASAMKRVAAHHVEYRRQLLELKGGFSGIKEVLPLGSAGILNHTPYLLFYAIPVLDLFVWCIFYAGEKLHIEFLIPW